MDDLFLDDAASSPRDRFLLMLHERVAALEAALQEYDVDAVEARLALPADARPFKERVAAAVRLAGEAAHAALPGAVDGVELSCSANDMGALAMLDALGPCVRSSMGAFGGCALEDPELTARVTLRSRRPVPALERALAPEFAARGLRITSPWERAGPRRSPPGSTWAYGATEEGPTPTQSNDMFKALMAGVMMHIAGAHANVNNL